MSKDKLNSIATPHIFFIVIYIEFNKFMLQQFLIISI